MQPLPAILLITILVIIKNNKASVYCGSLNAYITGCRMPGVTEALVVITPMQQASAIMALACEVVPCTIYNNTVLCCGDNDVWVDGNNKYRAAGICPRYPRYPLATEVVHHVISKRTSLVLTTCRPQ